MIVIPTYDNFTIYHVNTLETHAVRTKEYKSEACDLKKAVCHKMLAGVSYDVIRVRWSG